MELPLETVALFALKLAYETEGSSPILRDDLVMADYEREVFALLMEGFTMRRSAEELGVKFTTVNSHCRHIYRKLDVNSRAEFILRYGIGRETLSD